MQCDIKKKKEKKRLLTATADDATEHHNTSLKLCALLLKSLDRSSFKAQKEQIIKTRAPQITQGIISKV